MRRTLLWTVGAGVFLASAFLLFRASTNADQPAKEKAAAPAGEAALAKLDIGQVVLFSSGVGYFQREGSVEGTTRVDLSFPVSDINDLIKSMVLRDLDGGHVSTVSYDSNAPIERTLKSFAINLTGSPTLAQILTQARGEKVEVALTNAGAGAAATLSGTIVGLEQQKQTVGKDVVETTLLNLWCADGVRALKMADVQRLRFLNPVIDREFKAALETLALSHDTQKKAVSIRFAGEGRRRVKVGYVIENPIWKTSYRLVLGTKAGEKPYLQGWAVVENPSDEDWKDVRMALVSGRPISFQMDLYTPLYVARPVVEPELFASLRPVAYSGRMDADREMAGGLGGSGGRGFAPPMAKSPARRGKSKGGAKSESESYGFRGGVNRTRLAQETQRSLTERLDLGKAVSSAASAAKLGDFFQYSLDKAVTLPRQKSALLPIVGKDVAGTRVSIYNERTQAKFPLLGLRFKNTSGLHLMQGPITVFEGSNYAGDARILDLQPNEERLLSYAVDLGTEVNPVPAQNSGRITQVKAVRGILHTTNKQRQGKTYTIKNRNDKQRTVLVEHPVNNAFALIETAKPAETASDFYRFELKVPAGETKTLTVTEERTFGETLSINTRNDENIRWFMSQPITSQRIKDGLTRVLALRVEQAKTTREIQEMERQLQVVTNDQTRLRANIREVPTTSAAYKRYVAKFDEQETQIEKYQADIKKAQGVEHRQRKALEDYLTAFSAD